MRLWTEYRIEYILKAKYLSQLIQAEVFKVSKRNSSIEIKKGLVFYSVEEYNAPHLSDHQ
jgi:hypothetical protein